MHSRSEEKKMPKPNYMLINSFWDGLDYLKLVDLILNSLIPKSAALFFVV